MDFKRKAVETAVVPVKKPRTDITAYGAGQSGALIESVNMLKINAKWAMSRGNSRADTTGSYIIGNS